jgi:hypothetical protein
LGYCLDATAAEFCRVGDLRRAARLFGAAETHWRRIRMRRSPPFAQQQHDEEVQATKTQLGDFEFERASNEGQAMETARVFALALGEDDD